MPQRTARTVSVWSRAALAAALLAACTNQSAPMTPPASGAATTPFALAPDALTPVQTYPGAVIGRPDAFHPPTGDYPSGGNGQPVDGLPCRPTMFSDQYHVHVYLGIVHEGKQIALPAGIGMFEPGAPENGFINTATCYYFLHTHDSSGIVHIESPKNLPPTESIYTLARLFDIWGVHLSSTQLGPLHGPLHVFVGNVPLKQTIVSAYREFKGDPRKIKLKSHEAVWLEFGNTYYTAAQLPPVTFYMEY